MSIVRPGDPRYDAASAGWNRSFQHRPAAVAQASTTAEVVEAVRAARAQGLQVAIQATGHGPAALAGDRALLLCLRGMRQVHVDPRRAVARVGGGARWTDVLGPAQDVGLAPLLGSSPQVGAVGYTLGGGIGWLARHHGLAVDSVRSLTVVLADGEVVVATALSEPDLFWALLGGGAGSLGVVVAMEIALVPVDRVYAGNLLYPLEDADEVFALWHRWIEDAPAELTSAFNVSAFPDIDAVPAPFRGRRCAIIRGCHSTDSPEARAYVDRLRAWRRPEADLFGPIAFRQAATISRDPDEPTPVCVTGRWLESVDVSTVAAMTAAVEGGALFVEVRHAGGAVARPNPAASYAARDSDFLLQAVGVFDDDRARSAGRRTFARLLTDTASQHAARPAYLNFVDLDERQAAVGDAFGVDDLDRLGAVKRRVDPQNLFSCGIGLHPVRHGTNPPTQEDT
ncbi:MAG: FAD-binding oxidoreductase [Nocardioidaceae bacterium]|nr:FAD-binding oxidoreductase [Nocardioidaceae bacterium]